jgi:hypothetical protein
MFPRTGGEKNPVGVEQRVCLWWHQLRVTHTPLGSMMNIEAYHHGTVGYASEKVLLPELGEELITIFEPSTNPDRAGLYVASENAGAQSSVLFWADALRNGVGFANPELFPWTLANAPCSWLARRFCVQGPNFTYLGGVDALIAALTQAQEDLIADRVDIGWVVAIDFAQEAVERTTFGVLRVSLRLGVARVQSLVTSDPPPSQPPRATAGIISIVDGLRQNATCTLVGTGCSLMIEATNEPGFLISPWYSTHRIIRPP